MSTTVPTVAPPPPVPAVQPLEPRERVILHDVPWDVYEALNDIHANRHVRMAYDDGMLELVSPSFRHEISGRRLALFVRTVTTALGLTCLNAGSTTLKRKGRGRNKGKAKEADTCFYLANEPRMRGKDTYDPAIDPPPDLAIEADAMRGSVGSLPIYAALGVPEVWRYDGVTLWFGRLKKDRTYASCKRSPGLPMLTPKLVLDWLRRVDDVGESQWTIQLLEWARAELGPRP